MLALRFGRFQFGLMLAVLSISTLPAVAQSYTPEQQQACTGDAFRLCGSDIPDVDRVTACMSRKKSQLSPGCLAHFRPATPSQVTAVNASRPLSIKPATTRKPVSAKPKKSKKPAKPAAA
jgi:hypothetical protein